jgi:hypothetical protein
MKGVVKYVNGVAVIQWQHSSSTLYHQWNIRVLKSSKDDLGKMRTVAM